MYYYILVAGADYEYPKKDFKNATDFGRYTARRASDLVQRLSEGADATIERYDVRTGLLTTERVLIKNGKPHITTKTEQRFERLTEKFFDVPVQGNPRFRTGQGKKVMSIVSIYDALEQVGKNYPSTLQEVSIFSHAGMVGPILVNSSSRPEFESVGVRDPDDRDGRAHLDFSPTNMNTSRLQTMGKAFAKTGHCWIWGCNFPRVINKLFNKMENHSKYSPTVKDTEVFEFSGLDDEEVKFLNDNFSELLSGPIKGRKIKVPFEWLKALWCTWTMACYPCQFAKHLGVVTYGAMLGTYAEFEDRQAKELRLPRVADRFRRRFEFYRRHLGIERDPEHLNYGRYTPEFDCKPSRSGGESV